MDKLIVSERGEAQITNDGATILKLLEIVHPAARTLVDIARAQDAEVGRRNDKCSATCSTAVERSQRLHRRRRQSAYNHERLQEGFPDRRF